MIFWNGKEQAIEEANKMINKTLVPCPNESVEWNTTENLYIEGDNLDALKLLQEKYKGKIKMIYIDPPYNTNNHLEAKLYKDNRNHDDWCNMIYSRLLLARKLLKEDGVIFISIDDCELARLRLICDDIFGEKNFHCNVIWKYKSATNCIKGIDIITEYILVYCKNQNHKNDCFKRDYKTKSNNYKYIDEKGKYRLDCADRGSIRYEDAYNYRIEAPDGLPVYPNGRNQFINDGWCWRLCPKSMKKGIKEGNIIFKKSKNNAWKVYQKSYENETSCPFKNLILDISILKGVSHIKKLFGNNNFFRYSKPPELIERLMSFVQVENEIVLDFFSGSASTAHGVMSANAKGGGKTKFIMVQLDEPTSKESVAYINGFVTISDLGKERIRRANKLIKEQNPHSEFDGGFKMYKISD